MTGTEPFPARPASLPRLGEEVHLADILDLPAIQELMDQFYQLMNVGMAIVDLRGNVLVATGWQDICTKFHRLHPDSCQHCVESDTALTAGVAQGAFKLYRCKNNMWDMSTPIMVAGRHLGNFFLGQFFFADEQPDVELFRAQARRYGFDEQDYLAALERVPRWDREKICQIMGFYTGLAKLISETGYRNLQLRQTLDQQRQASDRIHFQAQMLDSVRASVVASDLEGRIVYWGRGAEAMYGYPAAEVLGRPYRQFAGAIDPPDETAFRRELLAKGAWRGEHLQRRRDGSTFWTATFISLILDEHNQPAGFIGFDQDITDRKQIEHALQTSEARARQISRITSDVAYSCVAGPDGRFTFDWLSGATDRLIGYTYEEIRGQDCWRFLIAEADLARFDQFIAGLAPGTQGNCELRLRHKDGRLVWVSSFAECVADGPSAGRRRLIGAWSDITPRKLAEEDIRQLSKFPTENPSPVLRINRDGLILFANAAATPLLKFWNCNTGQSIPADWRGKCADVFAAGQSSEVEITCDGRVFSCLLAPITGTDYLNLYGRDITAAKQTETALRDSEEKFAKAFQTSPYALTLTRAADGKLLEVNPAFCKLSGYSPTEALTSTTLELGLWADPADRQNIVASLAQGRSIFNRECRFRTRDNRVFVGQISAQTVRIGTENCILSCINDVTVQKEATDALRASEERYRSILNASPDGITIADREGRILMASPSAAMMFGYPVPQDLQGRNVLEFVVPADRETAQAKIAALLQTGGPVSADFLGLRADGQSFAIEVNGECVRDVDGRPVHIVLVTRDVTARKQAEAALRASEVQLSNALEMAHAGHWEYEVASDTFTFNDNFYRIFHTTARQVGGYRMRSMEYARRFCHPEDAPLVAREIQALLESNDPHYSRRIEHRIFYADGTPGYIAVRFFVVRDAQGRPIKTCGVNQDITEQKQIEERLRSGLERLQDIAANIPGVIYQLQAGRTGALEVPFMTSGSETLLECPVAELVFTHLLFDHLHPEDHDPFRQSIEIAERQLVHWSLEFRIVTPAGRTKWLRGSAIPRPVPDRRPLWTGVLLDITDRRQAEDALREREAFQVLLMGTIPSAVFYKDREGRYLGFNKAFTDFFGQTREQLMGKTVFDIAPPELAQIYHAKDLELLTRGGTQAYDSQVRDTQGNLHDVVFNKAAISNDRGEVTGLIGIIHDITDRKRAEGEMARQLDELRRWYTATLDREERIAELKREVNALCARAGQPPPYPHAEDQAP